MYAVTENEIDLEGQIIQTYTRDVINANVLTVEAGTTGYKGGDSGHGGRTYIRIEDAASTDITVNPIHNKGNGGVEIILGGDAELETIITGLKFIIKVLEDQSNEVYD